MSSRELKEGCLLLIKTIKVTFTDTVAKANFHDRIFMIMIYNTNRILEQGDLMIHDDDITC